jgi:signal transduction histidine kinase
VPDRLLDRITAEHTTVRKILDFLPYPFLLSRKKDEDRENLFVNESFIDEIGYTLADIPTRSAWFSLAYPDTPYREKMIRTWENLGKINRFGHQITQVQAKVRTRGKGDMWFEIKSMQFDTLEVVAFINIHSIKTEEENLHVLNNNKNRILSILGHDIRGPIYNLLNMSELLMKDSITRDEFLSVVEQIHLKTVQAIEFLETTLTWTKSNFDGIRVNREEIRIRELITPVLELYRNAIDNKKFNLTVDVPDQLSFYTDKEIAIVLIRNLISNAIKYTPHGGSVVVRAQSDEHENKIFVTDTGIGMTAETIQALQRSSGYSSRYGTHQEKGLGIGLHLCNELLALLGGSMQIESSVGKGSTFTVCLPK